MSSDDEPPELVSGEPPQLVFMDRMVAMTLEHMERKDAGPTGPPVLCAAHVQGLGRGLACYGAQCNDNAVAVNYWRIKDQRKAEDSLIKELDLKRLVSSKVTSLWPARRRLVDRPAAGIVHPRHHAVRFSSHCQCRVYYISLLTLLSG